MLENVSQLGLKHVKWTLESFSTACSGVCRRLDYREIVQQSEKITNNLWFLMFKLLDNSNSQEFTRQRAFEKFSTVEPWWEVSKASQLESSIFG